MKDSNFLKNVGGLFAYIICLVGVECFLGLILQSIGVTQFTGWLIVIGIGLSFAPLIIAWPFSYYEGYWHDRSQQVEGLTAKFLSEYAAFGRRLWSFDNLWFMVFLIGFYATISVVAKEVITHKQSLGSAEIWMRALGDILIAAFLSVITSVVSHMFTGIETTSEKLESAAKILGDSVPRIDASKELLQHTCDNLEVVTSNLGTAEAQENIRSACLSISDEYKKTKENLNILIKSYNDYTNSCFKLLSPFGPFADYIKVEEHLPRCSYVSAILARYFASEIETRGAPGIYLNVTSFAFYVRTVMEIVESLRKWWKSYEFYTTVPTRPSDIFRFQNSTDIREWLEFLNYYHKFQQAGNGKWQRYFLYDQAAVARANQSAPGRARPSSLKFVYPSLEEIEFDLKEAIMVVKEKGSWIPKDLDSNTITKYIGAITGAMAQNETKRCNSVHEGKGTLVSYDRTGQAVKGEAWDTLENCLLKYHVSDKNFRYRNVDDIKEFFQQEIDIKSMLVGKNSLARIARFRMPRDIFAVKEIESDGTGRWVLIVARETGDEQISSLGLAFAPILELDMMDNTENRDVAEGIGKMLDKIFSDTKSLTHGEIKQTLSGGSSTPNV